MQKTMNGRRCVTMGGGLQEQLDRALKKGDLLRRDLIHSYLEKMEINPVGPIAQVMLSDYKPEILEEDDAFEIEAMTAWLLAAFPEGQMPARSA